jgi:hypothetical protein
MWGINTDGENSEDEFWAEMARWTEAAELCIPKIQQAINEYADWSSFPDMIGPPMVEVSQNFSIHVTVNETSTDEMMWETLHGLESLTRLRSALPTLVPGDDEPTPTEFFVWPSSRGYGIHIEDQWPPIELQVEQVLDALKREPEFLCAKSYPETKEFTIFLGKHSDDDLDDDPDPTPALSKAISGFSRLVYRQLKYGVEITWIDVSQFQN